MVRRFLSICGLAAVLALAGCDTPFSSTSVGEPPEATPYAQNQDASLDMLFDSFTAGFRPLLREQGFAIKDQQRYTTTRDLATVTTYYRTELNNAGWTEAPNELQSSPTQSMLTFHRDEQLCLVTVLNTSTYLNNRGVIIYVVVAARQ